MNNIMMITALGAGGIVGLAMITLLAYSRMYKRASADEALVRTGKGGTRAVAGGGMMVLPIFHAMETISLKQVMISITRTERDALITRDKIRADVEGTMYVRVGDNETDIIQAAKTFGHVQAKEVERLIADKVTDAMRAEAMKVSFLELNVNKREFGEAIAAAVQQDLKKTGLILDSVAVTTIRQVEVNPEAIPMDVFEAEGVRNIVAVVEQNREETNRIRREKEVAIRSVDVHARKKALLLDEEQRQAEADQKQRIASYEAKQDTEAKQAVLAQNRIAEEAAIAKEEEVAKRAIARDRALAVEAAHKDEAERVANTKAAQAIEQAEIDKQKAVEAATIEKQKAIQTAAIAKQKAVETAEVEKQKAIESAEVEKAQAVETAEVEKQKAIALAKQEEAKARAAQALAEAEQEEATQTIVTVTEKAEADRGRVVAIIKAREEAEKHQIDADRDAYVETKRAEAERDARKAKAEAEAFEALERARARREEAQGKADAVKIDAEAHAFDVGTRASADANASELQAKAKIELAGAMLEEGKARAEAERMLIEARNAVATPILVRDVAVEALRQAPAAIEAFMKPAAAIGEVKVMQLAGLDGMAANGNDGMGSSLPGIVTKTLAQSAGFLPVIRTMLDFAKDAGLGDKAKALIEQAKGEVREVVGASDAEAARLPEPSSDAELVQDHVEDQPAA